MIQSYWNIEWVISKISLENQMHGGKMLNWVNHLVLVWGLASLSPSAFSADSCIKVELKQAEKCSDLKISADLSACGDELSGEPQLHCGKSKNEIRVRGHKAEYRIRLKQAGGAWGGGEWTVGEVTEKKIASKSEHNSHAVSPVIEVERKKSEAKEEKSEAKAEAPAAANAAPAMGFQFAAYFDAYFAHNFNRPAPVTAPSSTTAQNAMIPSPQNNLHFYDWYNHQVGLNLAEFTVKHVRKETTFVLDLDFGQMADINAQSVSATKNGGPSSSTVDEVSKHIGQVVLTYNPAFIPGFTFEVGKMATHLGNEVIKAKDNWNYTRGALFSFGIPLWHTGVHVGYAIITDKLIVNAYMYTGWNTLYDSNSAPTVGSQVKWAPNDKFSVLYNVIAGHEQALNDANLKQVHELIATFNPAPVLSLALDGIYGMERGVTLLDSNVVTARWTGISTYAKIQAHPRYFISPRFEFYRDHNGYTLGGTSQNLYTATLTQALQITEGFEGRFEYRFDHSTYGGRFVKANGTDYSPDQHELLLALLYTM